MIKITPEAQRIKDRREVRKENQKRVAFTLMTIGQMEEVRNVFAKYNQEVTRPDQFIKIERANRIKMIFDRCGEYLKRL